MGLCLAYASSSNYGENMEVPALTSASFIPQQAGGVRAQAPSQKQSAAITVPGNEPQQQSATSEATARAGEAQLDAQQQKAEEKRTTATSGSEVSVSVGRIRFEVDEGTRIAKFFDTKDVLIYQVPPEGQIYLVRAQETSAQDQIETSA
jgi:hypothetical protein